MNLKPLKKNKVVNLLKSYKNRRLAEEKIRVISANNRILSKNIYSKINTPPFNNSAVDGYVIRNLDIKNGQKYEVIKRLKAGGEDRIVLKKNQAARIFTGAVMPINSCTVVMQENAIEENGFVKFIKKPKKNANWRLAGEDVRKNRLLLKKGTLIKPETLSFLASVGLNNIYVYKKVSIGFFTSGNELKNPTTKLIGSQINNSNRFALYSLLKKSGFDVIDLGVLKDNRRKINKSLTKASKKFDILITSGGASVGDEDHLINVLREIGKINFWKIAIKPGRPLAFGEINKRPIFCLPGNPVSVFLLFAMIVKPFLLKLSGTKWQNPKHILAKINFSMKKKTQRMEWLRVNVKKTNSNELIVKKFPKQGSGIISSIVFSDGIIEIPENKSFLKPGDVFKFYPSETLY
tara:strand:+ start:746 stop:1963 length:1218 start_codon:yes stop_codon:yes gene_type:complete